MSPFRIFKSNYESRSVGECLELPHTSILTAQLTRRRMKSIRTSKRKVEDGVLRVRLPKDENVKPKSEAWAGFFSRKPQIGTSSSGFAARISMPNSELKFLPTLDFFFKI